MTEYVATTEAELAEAFSKADVDDDIIVVKSESVAFNPGTGTRATVVLVGETVLTSNWAEFALVIVRDRARFYGQAEVVEVHDAAWAQVYGGGGTVYADGWAVVEVWDAYVEADDHSVVYVHGGESEVRLFGWSTCYDRIRPLIVRESEHTIVHAHGPNVIEEWGGV